ncbi:MAG: hypothetical protein ACI4F0_08245 [Agathobacter sp.]
MNKKKKIGIATALMILLLFAICLLVSCNKKVNKEISKETTDTRESFQNERLQEELAAYNEQMREEMTAYMEKYLADIKLTESISEEELQIISEDISTGIIESIPQESLLEEEKEELQRFVVKMVQEQMALFKEEKSEADGDIDDLKTSLAAESSEYAGDKAAYDALFDRLTNRIAEMESSGATNEEVENMKTKLGLLSSSVDKYSTKLDETLNGIIFYIEDGHLYGRWTDEEGNVISKKLDFAQ